jgi:hypothetical protein
MTFVARTAKDLTQNVRPGRPATVQVEKPSATVRIPFTVTSADIGRSVQWSVSRSTFSPGVRLWVLSPSGFPDLLADVPARASGTGTSPWQLFEPGSYTLVVDPVDGSTGSARVSYSLTP